MPPLMKYTHWYFWAALSLMTFSCIEEQDVFIPDENTGTGQLEFQSPLLDFYEVQGLQFQEFTVDPSKDEVLESAGQLKIYLPAGTLTDSEGNTASNPAKIQLLEAFNKGDLILFNIASAYADILHSMEAAFFMGATAGGKPLKINPATGYEVNIPLESSGRNMTLFAGEWPSQRYFNWAESATKVQETSYVLNNGTTVNGQALQLQQLFWNGLGQSLSFSGPRTKLYVRTLAAYDPENTSVFFVFDRYPAVLELQWESANNSTAFYIPDIPTGESGRLILISKQSDGNYHFDQRAINISGISQTEVLEPVGKSLSDIRQILDNL